MIRVTVKGQAAGNMVVVSFKKHTEIKPTQEKPIKAFLYASLVA